MIKKYLLQREMSKTAFFFYATIQNSKNSYDKVNYFPFKIDII